MGEQSKQTILARAITSIVNFELLENVLEELVKDGLVDYYTSQNILVNICTAIEQVKRGNAGMKGQVITKYANRQR